jgi:WD40 repeat protein
VWKKDTFELLEIINREGHVVCLLQVNNSTFLALSKDTLIHFWTFKGDNFKVTDVIYTQYPTLDMVQIDNNTLVYSTDMFCYIFIARLNPSEIVKRLDVGSSLKVLMKLDNYLITGSDDGVLGFRDINNNYELSKEILEEGQAILSIVKLNSKLIATGSTDSNIRIYNMIDNDVRLFKILQNHTWTVESMIRLKDGRLVSGSRDNLIIVWGLCFEVESVLGSPNWGITDLIQVKDGRIASVSNDMTIKIWS